MPELLPPNVRWKSRAVAATAAELLQRAVIATSLTGTGVQVTLAAAPLLASLVFHTAMAVTPVRPPGAVMLTSTVLGERGMVTVAGAVAVAVSVRVAAPDVPPGVVTVIVRVPPIG